MGEQLQIPSQGSKQLCHSPLGSRMNPRVPGVLVLSRGPDDIMLLPPQLHRVGLEFLSLRWGRIASSPDSRLLLSPSAVGPVHMSELPLSSLLTSPGNLPWGYTDLYQLQPQPSPRQSLAPSLQTCPAPSLSPNPTRNCLVLLVSLDYCLPPTTL